MVTGTGEDAGIAIPNLVDIITPVTNPRQDGQEAAGEEHLFERSRSVPESITTGFVPESVLVVDNDVVVELP